MEGVEKALFDQGYRAKFSDDNLVLKRKGADAMIIVATLVAIPVMWLGLYAHFTVFLFGLSLLLAPWIFRKWQFPPEIQFVSTEGLQLVFGPLDAQKKNINFSEIQELQLERTVKPSDVSPFMESNEDFVYNFVASTNDERHKLIRLVYRVDNQEEVEKIRNFLLQYLRTLKSEH